MEEQNFSDEQMPEQTDEELIEQIDPMESSQANNKHHPGNNQSLSPEDHWNSFMFGSRKLPEKDPQQPPSNQIDFTELMYNIDTLMASVSNLKPLFEQFYPYLQQFWKK